MIGRAVPLAALAMLAGTGVATATPQRSFAEYQYSRAESDRGFADFADCIIGSRVGEQRATMFLRHVPHSVGWQEAGAKLAKPECLSGIGAVKLRFNLVALRPALFAALYRRRFGKTEPAPFDGQPALVLAELYDGSVEAFPTPALAQLSVGDCLARADTAAVHRLLVARPWTKAEDAALPAVTTTMSGCLPTGQTLRLNRSAMRGVVAEAMYHLASRRAAGASSAPAAAGR